MAVYPDILTGESPKTSKLKTTSWGLGIVLLVYFYAYFNAMTTGDVDLAGCHALEEAVTARVTIPMSVSSPGQPGIFCDRAVRLPLLTQYEKVYVYGVTETAEQDAILGAVREFQGTQQGKQHGEQHGKILVEFFLKENWQAWSDPASGRSGGKRGPETAMRAVWTE